MSKRRTWRYQRTTQSFDVYVTDLSNEKEGVIYIPKSAWPPKEMDLITGMKRKPYKAPKPSEDDKLRVFLGSVEGGVLIHQPLGSRSPAEVAIKYLKKYIKILNIQKEY